MENKKINKEMETMELAVKQAGRKSKSILDQANSMVVTNDEGVGKVTETLGNIKKFITDQENDRKSFVKPLNDVVKSINERFKDMLLPIREADRILRDKLGAYQSKKEEARRKEEQRLQKLQDKKVEKAENKGVDVPEQKEIKVETKKSYSGGATKTSFKTVKKYEVKDESKIPGEYWSIDDEKINNAVQSGVTEIDGVKIWTEQVPIIR